MSASTTFRGPVDVQVRRDIVNRLDDTLTTLSGTVTLNSGNNAVEMGSFTPLDLTGTGDGRVREYFLRVYWSGQQIYEGISGSREWVKTKSCSTGGGGGGSVAYGTMITVSDGTKVPVQNLKVGDELLGYDTATGLFTVATITDFIAVDTSNMLVITTEAGAPLRVDANPAQTLYVKTRSGTVGWLSVTELQTGDFLFHEERRWVEVTSIQFAPQGRHVMFDIISTAPYFANGYLDPPMKM